MIIDIFKKLLNPKVYVYKYTKFAVPEKYQSGIGEHSYGHIKILDWDDGTKLKIGRFCSFAKDVTVILGGEHRADWITMYPFSGKIFNSIWQEAKDVKGHPRSKGDIIIGNDVWVGYGATILSGVTIGDGAVIGARALITKDVEPYSIVAGNPAKFIRKRFSDKVIKELLRIKWWNWPEEKIKKNIKNLLSENIWDFINAY